MRPSKITTLLVDMIIKAHTGGLSRTNRTSNFQKLFLAFTLKTLKFSSIKLKAIDKYNREDV